MILCALFGSSINIQSQDLVLNSFAFPENASPQLIGKLAVENHHKFTMALIVSALYNKNIQQIYLDRIYSLVQDKWDKWEDPDPMTGILKSARFWSDDMFFTPTIESRIFNLDGDPGTIERVTKWLSNYVDTLLMENGLIKHTINVPFVWGRGMGWATCGLTNALQTIPESHPKRQHLMDSYLGMMAALIPYQSSNGLWRQLVDYQDAWEETSGSAMFAYSMLKGIKFGWLDQETFGPVVERAWLSLAEKVNSSGELSDVCVGTNEKYTAQEYLDRPRETGDYHGQAPLLWFAEALLDFNKAAADYADVCEGSYTTDTIRISNYDTQPFEWSSGAVDISCASSVNISMNIEGLSESTGESTGVLKIFYRVDGGAGQMISEKNGVFSMETVSASGIKGNVLELFVQGTNSVAEEVYYVSNINIEKLGDKITHALTVNNGWPNDIFEPGMQVPIFANELPPGEWFDRWVIVSGDPTIDDIYASFTTLTMPDNAVEITATYMHEPAWKDIIFDDFNSGFGNWIDGGDDCIRTSDSPIEGTNSLMLVNDNLSSLCTSIDLPLSGSEYIKIEFQFKTRSLENGDEFRLQLSTDSGNIFTTVKTWIKGTDFASNDVIYSESLVISDYTLNDQTRFRFISLANSSEDFMYFDNIRISADTFVSTGTPLVKLAEKNQEILVFPNPACDIISISINRDKGEVRVYDLSGRFIMEKAFCTPEFNLDVSKLSTGVYVLKTGNSSRKIVIK